jgi:ABC-2 type transport system ATP-binding protein
MPATNVLKIEALNKSFENKKVLNNISLSINQGEVFGLIGLNGAGKTTMIKAMLGLLKADSGEIEICGTSAKSIHARKNICYLPEKFSPSPYIKGREFIDFTLRYASEGKNSPERSVIEKMFALLDLDIKTLKEPLKKYSKGMGQKLGLVATFLSGAPLLILDEPMSGLDPKARIMLKEQIKEYKKSGKTVFFSSHILSDIEEICDSIAILHNAEIMYHGKPNDFALKHKSNTLEQAFLKLISH